MHKHSIYIFLRTLIKETLFIVPYGNHGCSCGDVNNAFRYVINNNGLDTENAYPYVARVCVIYIVSYKQLCTIVVPKS